MESFNENRDVTPVGSPDRAERDILGNILHRRFLANSGGVVVGEPLFVKWP